MPQTYFEDFDDGPGGWLLWLGGGGGPLPTDIREGALVSRSPWGVDFNHAPPGAGYLHLLYVLPTRPRAAAWDARLEPFGGAPRFIQGDFPRDFTHARIAVRVRGEIDLKGSHMLLLIQGDVGPVRTNWVLHAQPVVVTREWSEQTLALEPDERQWTCLGARASGADCSAYGRAPLADCLRNVNVNIINIINIIIIFFFFFIFIFSVNTN